MGRLSTCFIFGPVGGGERVHMKLREGFSFSNWCFDLSRDIANLIAKANPWLFSTCKLAKIIYVTSEASMSLVPKRYRHKAIIKLQIGLERLHVKTEERRLKSRREQVKLLYVGRMLYWKGMSFGLAAFRKLAAEFDNVSLTIVGEGPDEGAWKALASQLGIAGRLIWIPWVDQDQLSEIYLNHDIFLFPSLHDSGGLVVLEAMSYGLPVICLNIGGPGVVVTPECGISIDPGRKDVHQITEDIYCAMRQCVMDLEKLSRLSASALKRCEEFDWSKNSERSVRERVLKSIS